MPFIKPYFLNIFTFFIICGEDFDQIFLHNKLTIDIKHWNMTRYKWISNQTINTITIGCMKWDRTFGILATCIHTGISTFFVHTGQIIWTIRIGFTLWSTIWWNAFIAWQTCTRWTIIHIFACWISSTRWCNTWIDWFIFFNWWWCGYAFRFINKNKLQKKFKSAIDFREW